LVLMIADFSDTLVRTAAFEHVRRLSDIHDHLTAIELKPGFMFRGERIPLINPRRGIFKPHQMSFLLSIKTVFRKPGGKVWYETSAKCTGKFSKATRRSITPSCDRTPMPPTIDRLARHSRTEFRSFISWV
jgi:hypothetical protein